MFFKKIFYVNFIFRSFYMQNCLLSYHNQFYLTILFQWIIKSTYIIFVEKLSLLDIILLILIVIKKTNTFVKITKLKKKSLLSHYEYCSSSSSHTCIHTHKQV